MERNNIIVLQYKDQTECWGSLTEICDVHGWSYNYLKKKKYPFKYKDFTFNKVPFRFKIIDK